MIKVLIFQGDEGVGEDNVDWLEDWTPETIEAAFVDYLGPDWAEEKTDMFDGSAVFMIDTIDILNDRFAQAVTCPCDGGMTYLVRL